jgi:hypothetical protein
MGLAELDKAKAVGDYVRGTSAVQMEEAEVYPDESHTSKKPRIHASDDLAHEEQAAMAEAQWPHWGDDICVSDKRAGNKAAIPVEVRQMFSEETFKKKVQKHWLGDIPKDMVESFADKKKFDKETQTIKDVVPNILKWCEDEIKRTSRLEEATSPIWHYDGASKSEISDYFQQFGHKIAHYKGFFDELSDENDAAVIQFLKEQDIKLIVYDGDTMGSRFTQNENNFMRLIQKIHNAGITIVGFRFVHMLGPFDDDYDGINEGTMLSFQQEFALEAEKPWHEKTFKFISVEEQTVLDQLYSFGDGQCAQFMAKTAGGDAKVRTSMYKYLGAFAMSVTKAPIVVGLGGGDIPVNEQMIASFFDWELTYHVWPMYRKATAECTLPGAAIAVAQAQGDEAIMKQMDTFSPKDQGFLQRSADQVLHKYIGPLTTIMQGIRLHPTVLHHSVNMDNGQLLGLGETSPP